MAATKYTEEDKIRIVNSVKDRVKSGELSLSAASAETGINRTSLTRWIDSFGGDEKTQDAPSPVKKSSKRSSTKKTKKVSDSIKPLSRKRSNVTRKGLKTIKLPSALVIAIGSESHEIKNEHPKRQEIETLLNGVESVSPELEKKLMVLINGEAVEHIKEWSEGLLSIKNGIVTWDGKPLVGKLGKVLLNFAKRNDKSSLCRFSLFISKVNEAVSYKVTNRLFDFLNANDLRIDEEGDVIGFKVVSSNYKDKHSGKFDNSVGNEVSMPRNQVDDRDEVTCSNGLHFCSYDYVKSFSNSGDRLVLVKVDPRDFVSVPVDYNATKARVCRYKVIEDVTQKFLTKDGSFVKQYTEHNNA